MSESYQAICVDAEWTNARLVVGREYTCIPDQVGSSDLVTIPGIASVWGNWRFQRISEPPATTPAPTPAEAAVAPAEGLAGTLAARGSRYGSFETNGRIAQELKAVMRGSPNWSSLSGAQAEALDMFASKISRLLTGDPDYADNWHDIAGYATLVENTLTTKN